MVDMVCRHIFISLKTTDNNKHWQNNLKPKGILCIFFLVYFSLKNRTFNLALSSEDHSCNEEISAIL